MESAPQDKILFHRELVFHFLKLKQNLLQLYCQELQSFLKQIVLQKLKVLAKKLNKAKVKN